MDLARKKNPRVRIVASAIALETIGELTRCKKEAGFVTEDVTCITVSGGKEAGPYTLMQGQNPVYLFTYRGEC